MKRFYCFSMLLVFLLAACSPGSSGYECKEGICVSIEIQGPVQASIPANFFIYMRTEKDMNDLPVGLSVFPGMTIMNVDKIPESARQTYRDERISSWSIDTKGGEEYTFSGDVVLEKPTASSGFFSYTALAYFSQPEFGRVIDSIVIHLDAKGNQVDERRAKLESQTGIPIAPTPPPDLTIVPETPMPTVAWPTATTLPSPTPTEPAYPAPGENIQIDGAEQALPAYP